MRCTWDVYRTHMRCTNVHTQLALVQDANVMHRKCRKESIQEKVDMHTACTQVANRMQMGCILDAHRL